MLTFLYESLKLLAWLTVKPQVIKREVGSYSRSADVIKDHSYYFLPNAAISCKMQ